MIVETHIDIHRPAAEVFAVVSDHTKAPKWQHGLHEVRRVTDGPIGVGTEHIFVRRFAGKLIESRNRFVQFDEAAFFVEFAIPSGQLTGKASYHVVPTGSNSCRLISTMNFTLKGIWRLFAPILARILKNDSNRDEQKLKGMLETGEINHAKRP